MPGSMLPDAAGRAVPVEQDAQSLGGPAILEEELVQRAEGGAGQDLHICGSQHWDPTQGPTVLKAGRDHKEGLLMPLHLLQGPCQAGTMGNVAQAQKCLAAPSPSENCALWQQVAQPGQVGLREPVVQETLPGQGILGLEDSGGLSREARPCGSLGQRLGVQGAGVLGCTPELLAELLCRCTRSWLDLGLSVEGNGFLAWQCGHDLGWGELPGLGVPVLPVAEPLEGVLNNLCLAPPIKDGQGQVAHVGEDVLRGGLGGGSAVEHGNLPNHNPLERGPPGHGLEVGGCEGQDLMEGSPIQEQRGEALVPGGFGGGQQEGKLPRPTMAVPSH
eukprot:10265182-Lingulodinium_polyedra.AAC.1